LARLVGTAAIIGQSASTTAVVDSCSATGGSHTRAGGGYAGAGSIMARLAGAAAVIGQSAGISTGVSACCAAYSSACAGSIGANALSCCTAGLADRARNLSNGARVPAAINSNCAADSREPAGIRLRGANRQSGAANLSDRRIRFRGGGSTNDIAPAHGPKVLMSQSVAVESEGWEQSSIRQIQSWQQQTTRSAFSHQWNTMRPPISIMRNRTVQGLGEEMTSYHSFSRCSPHPPGVTTCMWYRCR
jgi:hypothetical protein